MVGLGTDPIATKNKSSVKSFETSELFKGFDDYQLDLNLDDEHNL